MPNLKEVSNSILEIVNKKVIINKEIKNIIIAKKYLLISVFFALILFKDNLLEYIWLGFEWERILLIENLIRVITFITLNPELVEKKEPPKITRIRKTNTRLFGIWLKEIPILETLLHIDTSMFKKLLS